MYTHTCISVCLVGHLFGGGRGEGGRQVRAVQQARQVCDTKDYNVK
jgi:hypothetical protein